VSQTGYIKVILPLRLEWEPCYSLPDGTVAGPGEWVNVTFAGKPYTGIVSEVDATPDVDPSRILPVSGLESGFPPVSKEEITLFRSVADYYMCSVGEVFKAAYTSEKIREEEVLLRIRERLEKRIGILEGKLSSARKEETRERYAAELEAARSELAGKPSPLVSASDIQLSSHQTLAYEDIKKGFRSGKTVLLTGVTGSGKTEIYLKIASEVLESGKSVLYMVPEIALSRQLEDRVREAIPQVMVFHSQETAARRRNTAASMREKGVYMVLGTRSSVFLPHRNLGLVIVDEEHDASFKQDSPAPRYNGRDVALMLASIHKADALLGSATPSLESIYNSTSGKYASAALTERFYGGDGSDTLVIDTGEERRKGGMDGHISRKLFLLTKETLSEGGQAVYLRARRSWAPSVQCSSCGKTVKCPQCGVPMSLHKDGGKELLRCHHCGFSETYSGVCINCGGSLVPVGAGSQRIEQEVKALFPDASVARIDSDVTPSEITATVKAFGKGEIDILIGTQMVSKGFDFAGVSLVAVLQADSVLGIPDFRADEKGLQLLEQFKGRTGRRGKKGLFVIQTAQSTHPVITGERAVENLLKERKFFGYPPYTRQIDIDLFDNNVPRLQKMGNLLSEDLKALFRGSPVAVSSPYNPFVADRKDSLVIRVNLPKDRSLSTRKSALREKISSFEKQFSYRGHISLNVDPL